MIILDENEIESTGLAEAIRLMKKHITFSAGLKSDISLNDKFFILGVMSWIHAQWPHVSK